MSFDAIITDDFPKHHGGIRPTRQIEGDPNIGPVLIETGIEFEVGDSDSIWPASALEIEIALGEIVRFDVSIAKRISLGIQDHAGRLGHARADDRSGR